MPDIFPPIATGTYRHSKTGKLYQVLGMALQTETAEPLVIYQPLYKCQYELFARPYAMFIEQVKLEGKLVDRFEKLDEST